MNSYYGKHIQGIPFAPEYQEGILKRNPRGDGYPMQVSNKEGEVESYGKWEKKHFSKAKGRPKLYTDEERKQKRREYSRERYKLKKEKERKEFEDRIKII